jgi:hypothetical protein
MDSIFILRILNLILALFGIGVFIKILKKIRESSFITPIAVSLLILLINISLFYFTYIIDSLFSINLWGTNSYNIWSTFVRTQSVFTILYIATILWRRIRK